MAYASIQDVQLAAGGEERLRQLSDWRKSSEIGEAEVQSAVAEADSWIDAALSKRFHVPLPEPVPTAIVTLSAAEAVYLLKSRRSMVTEVDQAQHEERVQRLRDIATGVITVGVLPLPLKSELVRDRQSDRPSDKAVSREKTKGFW